MKVDQLISEAEKQGFNLSGKIKISEAPDKIRKTLNDKWPRAKSAIIFASGGRSIWTSQKSSFYKKAHQEYEEDIDYIENYTTESFKSFWSLLPELIVGISYPFKDSNLNFRELAELSGIGIKSPTLELILNKKYGSWVSLSAMVLISEDSENSNQYYESPCNSCFTPCIISCPAQAISLSGIDLNKCYQWRMNNPECNTGCLARRACPEGSRHQPDIVEGLHRNKTSLDLMKEYFESTN